MTGFEKVVVDTNVLVRNISIFNDDKYCKKHIVIPSFVLGEVDNHKSKEGELGYGARLFSRTLDSFIEFGTDKGETLKDGIMLDNGSMISVYVPTRDEMIEINNDCLGSTYVDDKIISLCKLFIKDSAILTGDINLRAKASAIGMKVDYNSKSTLNLLSDLYEGVTEISDVRYEDLVRIDKGDLNLIASVFKEEVGRGPYPNEFVVIKCHGKKLMFRYDEKKGKCCKLKYANSELYEIKAKNDEQKMLIEALMNPDIKLVSITGKMGTGKTFLACASALQQVVNENKYEKILIGKNTAPIDKWSYQGYSTGHTDEKIITHFGSYLTTLENLHPKREKSIKKDGEVISNNGEKIFESYHKLGKLDILDVSSILGSSFMNKFIILDEAQSFDPMAMKSIATRVGENTKIVIMGDVLQSTVANLSGTKSGLFCLVDWLKEEDEIAHITLKNVERSSLVRRIAKVFEEKMYG